MMNGMLSLASNQIIRSPETMIEEVRVETMTQERTTTTAITITIMAIRSLVLLMNVRKLTKVRN